jgi:hypothetical protein
VQGRWVRRMTQLDATAMRGFLGLTAPPPDVSVEVVDSTQLDGHRRLRVEIGCADGDTIPALLLVPGSKVLADAQTASTTSLG